MLSLRLPLLTPIWAVADSSRPHRYVMIGEHAATAGRTAVRYRHDTRNPVELVESSVTLTTSSRELGNGSGEAGRFRRWLCGRTSENLRIEPEKESSEGGSMCVFVCPLMCCHTHTHMNTENFIHSSVRGKGGGGGHVAADGEGCVQCFTGHNPSLSVSIPGPD